MVFYFISLKGITATTLPMCTSSSYGIKSRNSTVVTFVAVKLHIGLVFIQVYFTSIYLPGFVCSAPVVCLLSLSNRELKKPLVLSKLRYFTLNSTCRFPQRLYTSYLDPEVSNARVSPTSEVETSAILYRK